MSGVGAQITTSEPIIHDVKVVPDPVQNKLLICDFVSEKVLRNISFTVRNVRTGASVNELIEAEKGHNTHKRELSQAFVGPCVIEIKLDNSTERHTLNIFVE